MGVYVMGYGAELCATRTTFESILPSFVCNFEVHNLVLTAYGYCEKLID